MIGKLRALLGWFHSPSRPSSTPIQTLLSRLQAPQENPALPEQHPEEIPVPRWEERSLHGHVLLDLMKAAAGGSGRNTLYGAETITNSGKRYTLPFTRTLPTLPMVVGWQVHFIAPEGNRLKAGRVTRLIRLEPDGNAYVNLLRPDATTYIAALQADSAALQQYLRALHWEPI
ncbi:hypothetical protein [Deinococcus roseus]|uniref:Uncharacterized protein n=1 Tax=Deinococcus roseus TaxID=392414 RepID=A0ABQ2CYT4_9DEIO|nr:hypothetical protein [Deinococcus roseus]GGJ32619.1 hypothetical protein GCM10008938_18530 [Deinococcus roseus]